MDKYEFKIIRLLIYSVLTLHTFTLPAFRPTFTKVTCTIYKVERYRWELQNFSVIQKSEFSVISRSGTKVLSISLT